MAVYKYTAKDVNAKKITGKMGIDGRSELAASLCSRDQCLIDCKDVTDTRQNTYKLTLKELSDFSWQLGTMIGFGVSLIRAMSILVQREGKPKIRSVYTDMYRKLQQGQTLLTAMGSEGKAFPELMINMYRTGESSGQMEKVAMTITLQYEKDDHIKRKIHSVMICPIILLCVAVFVIIVVFTWIVPSFSSVSERMELPLITKVVNNLSQIMIYYWYWLLIGILCMFAFIITLLRIEKVRYRFDKLKLSVPETGKLLCVIYTARFARNMCSFYTSGISIINGMQIIRSTVGNKYIKSQFGGVVSMVRSETSLSQNIQKVDGFDPRLTSPIYIGEEGGRLETMLTSLADDFDYESEVASQRMIPLLGPVIIIILALIVLCVTLAVLLPVYQMYQNPTSLE